MRKTMFRGDDMSKVFRLGSRIAVPTVAAIAFAGLCAPKASAQGLRGLLEDAQFSIGGNYQYMTQNPAGTNPSHNLNLTVTPSAIFKSAHEVGLSLGVTRFSQEIAILNPA